MLAVGLQSQFYGIYNLATGESRRPPESPELELANSVAFGADGKTLAVGMLNSVVLWDLATGAPQQTLQE